MSDTTNVLSFDLEHWYTASLLRGHVDPVDRIAESVGLVREVLDRHGVTATFFVVGEVAEERPDLVASLAGDGHEIGSHGQTHTPLFDLDRESLAEELAASARAIEAATGRRPRGFRAPNFSVTPRTAWALDVLADRGFRYDASVFPVKTPMYGVRGAPVHPYRPGASDPFAPAADGERTAGLVELPAAVFDVGLRVPVAGGFYARLFPLGLLKRGVASLNRRGVPATLYFHPWEFDRAVTTADAPRLARFVSFHGVDGLEAKLDGLLSSFAFGPAEEVARAWT